MLPLKSKTFPTCGCFTDRDKRNLVDCRDAPSIEDMECMINEFSYTAANQIVQAAQMQGMCAKTLPFIAARIAKQLLTDYDIPGQDKLSDYGRFEMCMQAILPDELKRRQQ